MGSETVLRRYQATLGSWRSESACLQRFPDRRATGVAISEEIVGSDRVGVARAVSGVVARRGSISGPMRGRERFGRRGPFGRRMGGWPGTPMPMFRCSARLALSDVSIEPIQEAGTRIQATMDDLPSRWVKGNSYPRPGGCVSGFESIGEEFAGSIEEDRQPGPIVGNVDAAFRSRDA